MWGWGAICFVAKRFFKEEIEIGERRGREGQWPGHILTITNGFTDKIILSVNPSVILSV